MAIMSARSLGGTGGCIEDDTGTRGNFLWLEEILQMRHFDGLEYLLKPARSLG